MPSAAPRSTTFVSPATTATPAARAAAPIDAATRRRSAIAKPSSTTKPAVRWSGRAPATARSLTVPFTASSPMSPPGKKSGLTTNESVVTARRVPFSWKSAASPSGASSGLASSWRKSPSTNAWVALPPAPCASVTCSSLIFGVSRRRRSTASSTSRSRELTPVEPPIVVVSRAGAFGGDHARADRPLGRARRSEHLALPRLDHALQHLAALARLGIGYADARDVEPKFRVPVGERRPELQRALRDEAEAPPLERRPQLHRLGDRLERARIPFLAHDARVLVLDLGAAVGELPEDHVDRLEHVERLESGDDQRLSPFLRNEAVRPRPDHRRDMARADEAVQAEVGRREDRADRRDDRDVVAEDGEVPDVLTAGAEERQ